MERIENFVLRKKTTGQKVEKWLRKIRSAQFAIEKQIRDEERLKNTSSKHIKEPANQQENEELAIVENTIKQINTRISRLKEGRSYLRVVRVDLESQLGALRKDRDARLRKSHEVRIAMETLTDIQVIEVSMKKIQKEMMKAGLIEEMSEDTVEGAMSEAVDEVTSVHEPEGATAAQRPKGFKNKVLEFLRSKTQ